MPNYGPSGNTTATFTGPQRYNFRTLRVLDAKEVTASQGALIILFGEHGAGKTSTAAKVAKIPVFAPAIIFDAEAGAKAVSHLENIVKVYPTHSWPEVRDLADSIYNAQSAEDLVYKTFIFDNLTEIQDICCRFHMAADNNKPYPELQHHGKVKVDLIDMVRKLRDAAERLQIVIILCVWEKNESGKADVNFIPSLIASIPGMVDYIGWMRKRGFGKRELVFEISNESAAKFRVPPAGPATQIPLTISFGVNDNPLGDILATLIGGAPWPTDKYGAKPAANVNLYKQT